MKDMCVHLYLVLVETGSHLFQIGYNGCCMCNHLRIFVRILVILGAFFGVGLGVEFVFSDW